MGVYIKGMEMPKEGNWITLRVFPDGQCFLYSWCGNDFDFMEHLTAVPVPQHGRLIDADALAEDLDFDVENDQRALDQMDFVGKEREHIQFDKDCKQNCMWYLSEAPTIIPAEKEGET